MRRTLEVTAHAKLNLTLRVIGRRADGLHLLDGITAFARFGDRIRVTTNDGDDQVRLTGPFATKVEGDNIVTTALNRYRAATGWPTGLAIEIQKNIPVAAGLGGGSSDAGAVLRVLQDLAANPLDGTALSELATSLGADVPVCLARQSVRMQGIGERLENIGPLPRSPIMLVNPGVALTAGDVFRRFNGPYAIPSGIVGGGWSAERLTNYIGNVAHNDLIEPAVSLAPIISEMLATLSIISGVRSVGMSGSGATCFAIFGGEESGPVEAAVEMAKSKAWWAVATNLLP